MKHNITADELGLKIERKEHVLFQWFLASYLFGKRIQQSIARQTWHVFMERGVDTPQKISQKSWRQLVELFGEGHYRRYDESMARNLHDAMRMLIRDYHGKILNMYDHCRDDKEFVRRLQILKGVGPKTTEIFMREASRVLTK